MKHRNRAKSSSLFLLELILAILFFSLASAVCVQFFVKSHILGKDARSLDHAVNECSGIAEIVNTSGGTDEALDVITEVYSDATVEAYEENGDIPAISIRIYYNKGFTLCTESEGVYTLQTELWEQGRMLTAGISMMGAEEDPIYELTVKHYLQRRNSDAKR